MDAIDAWETKWTVKASAEELSQLHYIKTRHPISLDDTNKHYITSNEYMVCEKTDGKNAVFFFVPQVGVFVSDRTREVKKLASEGQPLACPCLIHVIVEAEIVASTVQNRIEIWMYDCLRIHNNTNATSTLNLKERLAQLHLFFIAYLKNSDFMKHLGANIYVKEFFDVKSYNHLLAKITSFIGGQNEHLYGTQLDDSSLVHANDGVIFTPVQTYASSRIGSDLPILKLKQQETIDFQYQMCENSQRHKLLVTVDVTESTLNHFQFNGCYAYLISSEQNDDLHNKILECVHMRGQQPSGNLWKIHRIRTDKNSPNTITTAQRIMKLIANRFDEYKF
tara:strand:+ start:1233 stop:2240 length:1008 start_codon:yes stop_codon:yes gene_type:complete